MDILSLIRALGAGNLPAMAPPVSATPTFQGSPAGMAPQAIGVPGCNIPGVAGSPVPAGPVRQCQQDVPSGCSAGAPLRAAVLSDVITEAEITIEPSQMLFMTKLTVTTARSAAVPADAGVEVEIEYDGQTVFPRHVPDVIDIEFFSLEAQRAGLNPLPGGMPLFTRDRPMTLRYRSTGTALAPGDSIRISGVATLAAPSMQQVVNAVAA